MSDPTFTAPPDAPSRQAPSTFSARMDAFLAWMETFAGELGALVTWVNVKMASISASATAAANSAGNSATSASQAAASATAAASVASEWVSGSDWADGETAWSPITRQTYRTNGVLTDSTVDPSLDATNWTLLGADPEEISSSARLFSLWTGA